MNAPPFNTHMVSGVDPMPAEMASQLHQTPLPLAPVRAKAVALDCDRGRLAVDAGLLWRKDIADQLGFTRHRAAVLTTPARSPRPGAAGRADVFRSAEVGRPLVTPQDRGLLACRRHNRASAAS